MEDFRQEESDNGKVGSSGPLKMPMQEWRNATMGSAFIETEPGNCSMRNAFSIAELVIVAAVIGILAALAFPCLEKHAAEAKESSVKDSLRILRSAIEFYAARHGDVAPGYENDSTSNEPSEATFRSQMTGADGCMWRMPTNPFNGLGSMRIIPNDEPFPTEASGSHGWIYKPATKTIRVDWTGLDRRGVRYFDY